MAPDLLVLVKHARPDVDPSLPSAQWTLGVDGIAGSRRLADRLRPLGVTRVVTSLEPKAEQTGRIVAETLDLPFETGHDLHEHQRPVAGYQAREAFEAKIRRLFSEPTEVVFGDESADAAAARFGSALDALTRVHPSERLCVVAHGTVISLHLERRYGVDGWSTWKALDVPSYVVVDRRTRAVVELVSPV